MSKTVRGSGFTDFFKDILKATYISRDDRSEEYLNTPDIVLLQEWERISPIPRLDLEKPDNKLRALAIEIRWRELNRQPAVSSEWD